MHVAIQSLNKPGLDYISVIHWVALYDIQITAPTVTAPLRYSLKALADEAFFPALSISVISWCVNLISPAAMYPRILDSVLEVVIGTALDH